MFVPTIILTKTFFSFSAEEDKGCNIENEAASRDRTNYMDLPH